MMSMVVIWASLGVGAIGPFDDPVLEVTEPVVCVQVRGFRDYDEREKIELTPVDKLVVYDEPSHHRVVFDTKLKKYRAHLVEDADIRKKGQDKPIRVQKAIVDYQPQSNDPPDTLYLVTTIQLKKLPPGEYELDLSLRDALEPLGKPVKKTIPFSIIQAPEEPAAEPSEVSN